MYERGGMYVKGGRGGRIIGSRAAGCGGV
jgi:hypothetical protein